MKTTFVDAIAESRGTFLELLGDAPAAFFEVHAGSPSQDLERLIESMREDEVLLRFNMLTHSKEARARVCYMSELETMAYRIPTDKDEKPMPF